MKILYSKNNFLFVSSIVADFKTFIGIIIIPCINIDKLENTVNTGLTIKPSLRMMIIYGNSYVCKS